MKNIGERYRHINGMIVKVIEINNKCKVLIQNDGPYEIGHIASWSGHLIHANNWYKLPNQDKPI